MIKRDLLPALLDHVKEPEITILIGTLQQGKIALLFHYNLPFFTIEIITPPLFPYIFP